jgi:hypothetical protein
MLATYIIYPINKSEWASPIVVHPEKHDPKNLRICVKFRVLNKVTLTNPFLTSFVDGIINEVQIHECFSFIDGFLGYNQVPISKEDQANTMCVIEFGSPPMNLKQIWFFLGHIGYYRKFTRCYRKFIRQYLDITFPMDELLNRNVEFIWSENCDEYLKTLKKNLVEAPILIFLD